MSLLRRVLACALMASLAPGGAVFAQSMRTEIPSKTPDLVSISAPTDPVTPAAAPARLTDVAKRQAGSLVPVRERRHQGGPLPSPPMPAWAVGMIAGLVVGGYVGFGIEGRRCHCESGKGLLVGSAIGGVGGGLLVWRLTR
jgi:hypothetical protein